MARQPHSPRQGTPAVPIIQVKTLKAQEVGVVNNRVARPVVLPVNPDMHLGPRAEPKLSGPCQQCCMAPENTGRLWEPKGCP